MVEVYQNVKFITKLRLPGGSSMFADKEKLKEAFVEKLQTMYGECITEASEQDKYMALGGLIRDYISKRWIKTNKQYREREAKQVYYFSMEFLLGRLMGSNLINLDLRQVMGEALAELGIDLNKLEEMEADAGLGNGGLGRLAACFLDSMASMNLPGHGCGIRYKFGFFEQRIIDGYQVELPDNWLKEGNVWEIRKADKAVIVRFGGQVRMEEQEGNPVFVHENYEPVMAVPYDSPVIGYNNNTVNTLRLWSAEPAIKDFDFLCFNTGDHVKAVEYRASVEAISQVLYPDDNNYKGRELRLKQQYFFVSAGVQSIIRRFKAVHQRLEDLPDLIAIHINDTHPALAIPEMMRVLMDEEGMGWDEAWKITTNTIGYTNHTILAEALEKWPESMIQTLLPRIYMIIVEINERFCRDLWNKYPGQWSRIHGMAIVADGYVKMAHLAIVGSYSVNGVAKLHTEILKKQEMKNFYCFYPYKFNNKTNGVTHRRWLIKANPQLSSLVTEAIGPGWIKHPEDLAALSQFAQDAVFQERFNQIKYQNKIRLAQDIREKYNISINLDSIFDVQVKRLHAYKRQLLNVFHIMDLYNRLKDDPGLDIVPRTFIFGAKASPSYHQAKLTIKLINTLAQIINNDPSINDKIKVVFMENYRVSLAELIFPASDLSEQISTASKEASGTGNMKFMMNGALTIGTLDGANIEIRDEVGEENMFIFGLTAQEVIDYYQHGGYCSRDFYTADARIQRVVDQLTNGFFPVAQDEFESLKHALLYGDEYFVLKDFDAYVAAQKRVDACFGQKSLWTQKAIHNVAFSGKFSSDRTISEYASGIWNIDPVIIND